MPPFTKALVVILVLTVVSFACQQTGQSTRVLEEIADKEAAIPANTPSTTYLKPQQLLDFAEQAPFIQIERVKARPFDRLDFDKVIAYDYNDTRRPLRSIWDAERQAFASSILQQRALSKEECQSLIDLLTASESYGYGTAACFDPRLAFIFYRAQEKVMVVDICLDCNYLESSVMIPAQHEKVKDLGDGLSYPLKGFSRTAQRGIIELCRELDFYYGSIDADRLNTF